MDSVKRFLRDSNGASMVEYGLLIALIFVVIMGAVTSFGASMKKNYDYFAQHLPGG